MVAKHIKKAKSDAIVNTWHYKTTYIYISTQPWVDIKTMIK